MLDGHAWVGHRHRHSLFLPLGGCISGTDGGDSLVHRGVDLRGWEAQHDSGGYRCWIGRHRERSTAADGW